MKTIVRAVVAGGLAFTLAACTSGGPAIPVPTDTRPIGTVPPPSGSSDVPALAETAVRPLAGTGAAPFDSTRRLQAPPGWTVTVWARVPSARLLAWTPDRR